MFKKKKCKNCSEKVNGAHRYCPSCGSPLSDNAKEEDWGMLGKSDSPKNNKKQEPENELDMLARSFLGNMNKGVLGKMLGSAMKMLEKEMKKMENDPNLKNNFQLFINGKKIDPSEMKVHQDSPKEYKQQKAEKKFLSKDKIKKFTSLPKKEPNSDMKRFADSLVYEIDIPGVESIDDVLISKLESSIEIKALAKDKVYSKLIPVNLPIKEYSLNKNKLILQLDTN